MACGPKGHAISIHALLAESDHLFASSGVDFSISIHALLAESDGSSFLPIELSRISIHALLAESDRICQRNELQNGNFYPRSPCGERRGNKCCKGSNDSNFYPRSPCGERLLGRVEVVLRTLFLSTLSLRRATSPRVTMHTWQKVFLSTLSLRRATLYRP